LEHRRHLVLIRVRFDTTLTPLMSSIDARVAARRLPLNEKEGEDEAGALRNAVALLEGVLRQAPAEGTVKAA